MIPTQRVFWLPKQGNAANEYEDAFCPCPPVPRQRRTREYRYGIADGATEGAFSQQWARLLVRLYCDRWLGLKRREPQKFGAALNGAAQKWTRRVFRQPLPWFALEKATRGAFSTLAGLTLTRKRATDRRGIWHGFAVGDSCIMQVRDRQVIYSFPIDTPDQFGYHPPLLSSRDDVNCRLCADWGSFWTYRTWKSGDCFLLMTDALAHWTLTQHVMKASPWPTLEAACASQKWFAQWVETERAAGRMHNDDVTLMVISLG